jgi:hypothetical protein
VIGLLVSGGDVESRGLLLLHARTHRKKKKKNLTKKKNCTCYQSCCLNEEGRYTAEVKPSQPAAKVTFAGSFEPNFSLLLRERRGGYLNLNAG